MEPSDRDGIGNLRAPRPKLFLPYLVVTITATDVDVLTAADRTEARALVHSKLDRKWEQR
jgi:hypothetical protein